MAKVARAERRELIGELPREVNVGAFQGPDLDTGPGRERQRRRDEATPRDPDPDPDCCVICAICDRAS